MSEDKNTEVAKMNKEKEQANRYAEFQRMLFDTAKSLQYANLIKDSVPTYTLYTKDNYRTYIANPKRNEKELRNMSQFLSRVSMPYKRILWFFASIYSFYWNLTPKLDPADLPDEEDILSTWSEMCDIIDNIDMPVEMVNIIYFTLRDGVFYGFLYEDDNSIFIHRLNPDYCKPVQIESGVFNFAFDFSYFKKYPEALETWDPVFKTGYNAYERDSTAYRWQLLDPEKTICVKADPDLDENVPFFLGIFEALLDLIDARTLQRNKDIIQNYKLILQKIPFFDDKGSQDIDNFKLRLETVRKFSAALADSVPEAVGVATTPMEIDTVDFTPDDNGSDLLSSSMKQVFDDSGVSQLIFNSNISGSIGVDASIKTDAAITWRIVKYIERWVDRFIRYRGKSVKYDFEILDVNIFNKDTALDRELKLAQSGVPNKMKLAATSGITPRMVISSQIWENTILKLNENWVPLQTSYTLSSNNEGGRPSEQEAGVVSDTAAANRDSAETNGETIE